MQQFSKIILAGAAIAVIGSFAARGAFAKHADHNAGTGHYEQSGAQDRHADADRGHRGGKTTHRTGHRENRRGDQHATNQHAGNHHKGRGYGHHNRRANYYGWRTNYYERHGRHGRPYAHHINAAYHHGAVQCRTVSRAGYVRGHRALLGGIMCLDRHGIAFIIPQTRHVIHTY